MHQIRTLGAALLVLSMFASASWGQVARQPANGRPEFPVASSPPRLAARVPPPVSIHTPHGPAHPQHAPRPLRLSDLQDMALARNPTVGQAASRVEAARGRVTQARLWPNPTIGYLGSEIGNEGASGQQGGYISQQFVLGKKLKLAEEAAYQDLLRLGQHYEAQRLRVLTEVKTRFYEALIAQTMLDVSNELVGIGDRGVDTVKSLMEQLDAARVDLLQAEVAAHAARIQRDNAANRHAAAWRALAAAVGDPSLTPAPLEGGIDQATPPFVWDEALPRLLARSPLLIAARADAERARWAYQRARRQPIPNVTAQAAVQHDNATGDDVASVQIGVPLPLFNRNQGTIRQRRAEIAAAEAEIGRLELWLRRQLALAFERYENARQQTARYTEYMLPKSRESLELIGIGYAAGEFNYRDLLIAQRTFFQTNLDYLRSLEALRVSSAEIEGMLLADGLQPAAQ